MTESEQIDPRWAPRRWILRRYGISTRAFDRAVAEGYVRSCKLGSERQSPRVYFVPDCERYMFEIAAGRLPTKVAGRLR